MPVPSRITDLSATAADNSPAGTDTVGPNLDDYLRGIQAVLRGDLASKGADIASATTTDLGAVQGSAHDITGTTTITGLGTVAAGIPKLIKFEGALTLTHNATSLILPGGENITTANGDTALVVSEGSGNWRCWFYWPAAINPAKAVSTDESQTLTNKTLTSPTIQGTVAAGTGLTLPALTLGGALTGVIDSATGQIKFPASQNASADANTLDDYEEGTWTPTLKGATTTTYTGQVGRYTKIGRQVFIYCDLIINSLGDGSTTLITGLPFTANGTGSPGNGVNYFAGIAINTTFLAAAVDNGSTDIRFFDMASAGTTMNASSAIFASGARVRFSISYDV